MDAHKDGLWCYDHKKLEEFVNKVKEIEDIKILRILLCDLVFHAYRSDSLVKKALDDIKGLNHRLAVLEKEKIKPKKEVTN